MHVLADTLLSGASPLPHLDLHGSDRTHLALALGSGLITNLSLEAGLGQKCRRGLAPDSDNEVMHVLADTLLSGASPLPHLDLHGSDRTHLALALGSGLITNLSLEAGLGQKCRRGLAPDSGNEVMHVLADTLLSGASPLPHLDRHGSDRTHLALALGSGLITNLSLEAGLGQKCRRGLAPDSGNEVMHVLADTLLSGASPLPHLDLHGSDRTHLALALGSGLITNLILEAGLGQKCRRGQAPPTFGSPWIR
ncbi:hypothetical protein PVE_R1G1036 [Pseudomonas veronii 1YdBTEX2]|uniref:Uncharacterized protein n=1 Tax=Pseudomonas veronii 1YdBTEX2 TaxID=1295141 RepID=A0A1D3JS73_PSEVE|nr:hypothetical protein PVE_R1G1036 [Pseudomonas veronii 1YdBTEX2]